MEQLFTTRSEIADRYETCPLQDLQDIQETYGTGEGYILLCATYVLAPEHRASEATFACWPMKDDISVGKRSDKLHSASSYTLTETKDFVLVQLNARPSNRGKHLPWAKDGGTFEIECN